MPRRGRTLAAAGFTLLPVVLAMSLIGAIAFMLNRDNGVNSNLISAHSDLTRARYAAEAGLQAVNYMIQGLGCAGTHPISSSPVTDSNFGGGAYSAYADNSTGSPLTLTSTGTTAGGAVATLTRSNVTVYQQPPTIAPVQAADSTGTDAWLNWTKPTRNYGAAAVLLVQSAVASGLIQFNLPSIPAGSIISAATLQLSKSNSGTDSGTIAVYRVTRPWDEGTEDGGTGGTGATHDTSNGTTTWTTPGGDYDPAAVASLTGIALGWNSWDVTSLVQGWNAGSYPNYGMILVPTANVSANFVGSDWSGNAPLFPKLVVTYISPCP